MKLLYLGTGAAECIPALFCTCDICTKARKLGGRSIRSRNQALLDGKILFDYPADSFMHASRFPGFDLTSIRRLFITHSHMDHFYPDELHLRRPPFVASNPVETLHIYGNAAVGSRLENLQANQNVKTCNEFHCVKPFEPVEFDGYRITPLTALHARTEECLIYAASHKDKTMLFGHDTGFFPGQVWDHFTAAKMFFNLVSLDCTFCADKDGANHMGLPDCIEVREKLFSIGAADSKTVFVISHFSHNGRLNHDDLSVIAGKDGFITAYDGMEIEV